jgi:hypothetical protein
LEAVVKRLTGDDCNILGEMQRAEGGGTVYFAKQKGEDTIVGIRVRKGDAEQFEIDQTTEINFLPPHAAPTVHADSLESSQPLQRRAETGNRWKGLPKAVGTTGLVYAGVVVVVVVLLALVFF